MAEIRLPRSGDHDGATWFHDDMPFVSKAYHDALVADLIAIHKHDVEWATRVCRARGIDLDDLADRDPTYRAEFRV